MTSSSTCPVCRGQLHPVAGRCKHCKTDLVALRAAARERARMAPPIGWAPPAGPPPAIAPVAAAGSHAPVDDDATPRFLARHWPLLVGGVALIAIIGSLAVLLGGPDAAAASAPGAAPARAAVPGVLPDPMPDPMPGPNLPGVRPDGAAPDPAAPAPPPSPPPAGPGRASASPQAFATALTETVCGKLGECGVVDPSILMLCASMARELSSSSADLFDDPTCRFDGAAADACLAAVDGLDCGSASGADLGAWMLAASGLADCGRTYRCD